MALLAVATTKVVAHEMADHLRSAGFQPDVEAPRDEQEGNPLDRRWLIKVPANEHAPAATALRPLIRSGAAYLWPMTVYYIGTSVHGCWIRVVLSPETSSTVVDRPDLSRRGTTNPLKPEIMQQVRETAASAGLRIRTPGLCTIEEENLDVVK